MTIGQRINEFRKQKNLSINQLSIKSNIHRSCLCVWIYRDVHPDIDALIKLSDVFNISLDELVGRTFPKGE